MLTTEVYTPLDGVTATTTSSAYDVSGATKIAFEFKRADHSSGSSSFVVYGSIDGENFDTAIMMIKNVANSNGETLLRAVASSTIASNTQETWFLDDFMVFKAIKIKVTEVTDGTHTARMVVQYEIQ